MIDLERREEVAIAAVRRAARACRAVQAGWITPESLEKRDKSPVTVADFASQALVAELLARELPDDALVAEEDAADLRSEESAEVAAGVVAEVAAVLDRPTSKAEVCAWIDRGATDPIPGDPLSPRAFWTLDPIDGTKGFLRREQYAVALAYLVDGRVELGVLACPGLSLDEDGEAGLIVVARRGGGTRLYPEQGDGIFQEARVAPFGDFADARFCESVEAAHSDHGVSQVVARELGIVRPPLRMDSQAKYAVLARGDASIYLRLPTQADYREKIWDHAAGALAVTEAGGRVTDVEGRELDFSQGRTLAGNRGVVATGGADHEKVLAVLRGRV